jgi:hypothetical protein
MLVSVNIGQLLVFIFGLVSVPSSGLVNFSIPKADILHTKSGLILQYLSEYHPANRIVTFTVTIPMYPDMCHLIPKGSMKKIPQCQPNSAVMLKHARESLTMEKYKPAFTKRSTTVSSSRFGTTSSTFPPKTMSTVFGRQKRVAAAAVVFIGAGVLAGGTAIYNWFQNRNLKEQLKQMQDALQSMTSSAQSLQAQIFHLNDGELKVAHELNYTQLALNKTIALVNEHASLLKDHSDALRIAMTNTVFLSYRLASVVHATETHFIHTSMEDILANRLNLHFVHQKDLPSVIDKVSQSLNISFDDIDNSLPMVEVITRLLVRQQIEFIPNKSPNSTDSIPVIGQLGITSFFAGPYPDQEPFSVYEAIPVPFNQDSRRLRLAQMPAYIGLAQKSQQVIRWSEEEAEACAFTLMTTCRSTPPTRNQSQDECLYQILTDSPLKACRTETYKDPLFLRRVGHHWAISTKKNITCHSVTTSDLDHHVIGSNEKITLPAMVIVTTADTKSLICDQFSLPGLPVSVATPIHLIYNESVNPIGKDFLDLQQTLANETHWAKLPYIPEDMQAVIDFIASTPKPITATYFQRFREHPVSLSTMVLVPMGITLSIILVYYIRMKKNSGTNITVALSSMKALEAIHG